MRMCVSCYFKDCLASCPYQLWREVPHLQLLRVSKRLLPNPTSSSYYITVGYYCYLTTVISSGTITVTNIAVTTTITITIVITITSSITSTITITVTTTSNH